MATSSNGLVALLIRKGLAPTYDRATDLKLARTVMPKPYKRVIKCQ